MDTTTAPIRTRRITFRLDARLAAALERAAQAGQADVARYVRGVLAQAVGRPEWAGVNPEGRPRQSQECAV